MARIVDFKTAITRPIVLSSPGTFTIPSTNYTIKFNARDVCVIVEDRGNGSNAMVITDYTLVPIPTGLSYVVSAVVGETVIVPAFTIRVKHDGEVSAIVNDYLPSLTGGYQHPP